MTNFIFAMRQFLTRFVLSGTAFLFIASGSSLHAHQPTNSGAGNAAGAREMNGEQIADLMRANDAQFDNIIIEYRYTNYPKTPGYRESRAKRQEMQLQIDPDVNQEGIPDRDALFKLATRANPTLYRETYGELPDLSDAERKWVGLLESNKIKFVLNKSQDPTASVTPTVLDLRLGIRWPDLCAERTQISPEVLESASEIKKWKSIGQRLEHLDRMGRNSKEWTKTTKVQPLPLNSYQELATWLKFAFGIGYGQVIQSVKRMENENGQIILHADLVIWPDHVCHAILTLDDHFVVRKAEIDAGATQIHVTTTDTYSSPDSSFICAKRGSLFRHFLDSSEPNPKFDVEMQRIQFAITDQDFFALADMQVPEGHQVQTIDKDQMYDDRITPIVQGKPSSNKFWFIVANVVFLVSLAFLWFVRRRRMSAG